MHHPDKASLQQVALLQTIGTETAPSIGGPIFNKPQQPAAEKSTPTPHSLISGLQLLVIFSPRLSFMQRQQLICLDGWIETHKVDLCFHHLRKENAE